MRCPPGAQVQTVPPTQVRPGLHCIHGAARQHVRNEPGVAAVICITIQGAVNAEWNARLPVGTYAAGLASSDVSRAGARDGRQDGATVGELAQTILAGPVGDDVHGRPADAGGLAPGEALGAGCLSPRRLQAGTPAAECVKERIRRLPRRVHKRQVRASYHADGQSVQHVTGASLQREGYAVHPCVQCARRRVRGRMSRSVCMRCEARRVQGKAELQDIQRKHLRRGTRTSVQHPSTPRCRGAAGSRGSRVSQQQAIVGPLSIALCPSWPPQCMHALWDLQRCNTMHTHLLVHDALGPLRRQKNLRMSLVGAWPFAPRAASVHAGSWSTPGRLHSHRWRCRCWYS